MNSLFWIRVLGLLVVVISATGCGHDSSADPGSAETEATTSVEESATSEADDQRATKLAELVLAGGCFWCLEVAFEQLRGVSDVVSGYAGGTKGTADYQSVSAGITNHAEAIRITYDPKVISEETLLQVFFTAAHDPTQINRQYPDVGRQYRSTVFYTDKAQQDRVKQTITKLDESGQFAKRIATTLEPLEGFYLAEDYHQDYVKHHPNDLYVVAHSLPKAVKVRKAFPELIRPK